MNSLQEEFLKIWMIQEGPDISRSRIIKKAKAISQNPSFHPSCHWVDDFSKRHNISSLVGKYDSCRRRKKNQERTKKPPDSTKTSNGIMVKDEPEKNRIEEYLLEEITEIVKVEEEEIGDAKEA